MPKLNASYDVVEAKIKTMRKRIDTWSQQIEELQGEIEKLNRWIRFEQNDIDEAGEMLTNMQELEQCNEETNEA